MPELTGPQIIIRQPYAVGREPPTIAKLRRMRRDPVISLVRLMFFAGVLSGEWSYEGEDLDMVELIQLQMDPLRRHILATGALGCFDFGYQPYEKVFAVNGQGQAVIRKLKPLLQESVTIETDEDTGAFLGFEVGQVSLSLQQCLLLNYDVEGTNWQGNSTLENAEKPYDDSFSLQSAAKRFDDKMAGAHWIIYYPDGKANFRGQEIPNHEIADKILMALQSSGMIALPIGKLPFQEIATEKNGWKIELITASGASFPFTDRFDYLDKQKARALGFPERTILEGVHGTKADADSHQDFVITMIEYRHDCLLELINWHLVNQLLVFNYGQGAENLVSIKAASLNDSDRSTMRALYNTILNNPDGFLREVDQIDVDAMALSLGVPRKEEEPLDDIDPLPEANQ